MNVDKSEQRIRRMFGEIAARYDFLNHLLSGGSDYYWRWRTVRAVPPEGSAPVLDVCTGTGDLALAYWKKGSGEVPVVGADFTHEMLTRAVAKAAPSLTTTGKCPIRFVEADAQQLPFGNDRFQIVSVAFGLRNVTDTRRGLSEMVRVCAPGGRVVVLEFAMPSNRLLRGIYGWYFRNVLPKIGQLLARNRQSAYNYLPASVSEFPHGEALAELMRKCGLGPVEWRPLTFGVAALYVGTKPAERNVAEVLNGHSSAARPADSCAISS
jgi:demethylmenaquinone methyltransferase/2-methoxy-6-polyprenyl-1,4-benzoquinol methylase